MLIDWFTVVAQALNFLILVWLMKHFLYKPVILAIDEREKRIALALADAKAKKADAKRERDEFQHKNEEFDRQRASLLKSATDDAQAERSRLLDEARLAADALSVARQNSLKSEAHNLNHEIRLRTEQEVFAITRKTLADLAGTSLEESMVDIFIKRMRALAGEEKEQLISALKGSPDPVIVRTTFELPPVLSASIKSTIKETLGRETQVQFETSTKLISGIELTMNGHKVAWNIADYLTSMEKGIEELLKEIDKPEAKAKAKQKAKPKQSGRCQASCHFAF